MATANETAGRTWESLVARWPWVERRSLVLGVLSCLAIWASAELGAFLSLQGGTVVGFWLPAGLLVSALLVNERRHWPALVLGAIGGNVAFDLRMGTPALAIAGFCLANSGQALLGALLVQRFVARRPRLHTVGEFIGVMAMTGVVAPVMGALAGATIMRASGLAPGIGGPFRLWLGSNALAVLLVVPFVLAWSGPATAAPTRRDWRRILEALLLVVGTIGATVYLMVIDEGIRAPYKSRLFPFLLWAGLRFGVRGATAVNLLLALLVTFFTTHLPKGLGPADLASGTHVFALQTFLAIGALVGLLPAIALAGRDQAARALVASEALLRQFIKHAPAAIAMLDRDLRFVQTSDRFLTDYRLEGRDVIGQAHDRVFPKLPQRWKEMLARVLAGAVERCDEDAFPREGDPARNTSESAPPSGDARWLQWEARPWRDASGAIGGVILFTQVITERKRIEAALERERQQMEAIVDASMDGIVTVDDQQRIVVFNRAAAHMFRCPGEAALGQTLERFIPDHARAREAGYLRPPGEVSAGPGNFAALRGRRQDDGSEFPIEASLSALTVGDARLFTVTCRDVSERARAEETKQRLEAQLRQAQKMEAVGTLAGGIAHDFNNILGVILGNVALAKMDIHPQHPADESLREIERAGRRATQLVQQILMFSRQQETARRPLVLAGTIEDALDMLRSTLPARIELVPQLGEDVPIVLADPNQVHQILVNLCTNAWHAFEGQAGRIEIALSGVTVAPGQSPAGENVPPGRYACLRVTDNGTGMSPETMDRAFEPFFTTKAPGMGTGLGLSVVHGIVKDHGGLVSVISQTGAGGGTIVKVLLPAAGTRDQQAFSPVSPVSPLTRGQGQHVLYIDDEAPLVELTRRLLGRMGYRASGFTRPSDALEAVRTDPDGYDVVLTDFNMPGMSGVEVAQSLATIRPDLPVILASGYITDELRSKAAGAGVRHLIQKPNTAEELCAVVHGLVGQDRTSTSS